ncbi:MAG: tRNA (adenosine(37)-N6)-threonylcarbamoyltransferase complex ATPase subunit type 1 TsaE [Candidatus Paceibacterota bacterium]
MQKVTKSIEDFEDVARDFLDKILKQNSKNKDTQDATIVGLFGDLGAGKTTFVQYFSRILGIKQKINSPTFVLMKRYAIKLSGGRTPGWKNIYHIDAYRLEGKDIKKELEILGWSEIVSNPRNLILVEWPEIIEQNINTKFYKIYISHTKNNQRKFEFKML